MNLGNHIRAVDDEGVASRPAQGGMQHRPVLGHIDALPRIHRVAARGQAHLFGEIQERPEDLVIDEVLGQIDMQVRAGARITLRPVRIGRERSAQIGGVCRLQLGQAGPGGGGRGVDDGHGITLVRRACPCGRREAGLATTRPPCKGRFHGA